MGNAADPNVCKSCRRDTNRDAADAPRGGPPVVIPEDAPRQTVVTAARKQCRMCRGQWDGLIFGPSAGLHPSKDAPLPFGICPTCADADERRGYAVRVPSAPLPDLHRPRRVVGLDD